MSGNDHINILMMRLVVVEIYCKTFFSKIICNDVPLYTPPNHHALSDYTVKRQFFRLFIVSNNIHAFSSRPLKWQILMILFKDFLIEMSELASQSTA